MIAQAPRIGFDRFIRLDWVAAALRVRTGLASPAELDALLDAAALGGEARHKTRTKLNALVLAPRDELAGVIGRGVGLWSAGGVRQDIACFAWGAAVATYPYFAGIAGLTGRLTAIQGDCSMPEVHRRVSELYGERGHVKTATRAVIQTQVDWGVLRRVAKGNRVERLAPIPVLEPARVAWLIECALLGEGRGLALTTLQSHALLYPFVFEPPLSTVVSRSAELELRAEGVAGGTVLLRSAA